MKIVVIDGQGGGFGKSLIEKLKLRFQKAEIIGVGTNAMATAAMVKAGAHVGATGENAVVYNCPRADIICGPLGIVLADAMHGELTPRMAKAVAQSNAKKFLVPVNRCGVYIAGVAEQPLSRYIDDLIDRMAAEYKNE